MSFQLEGRSVIGTVKGGTLLGLMLLILTVLMFADVSRAAGDSKLRITQVESNLPDLRLFVELENVNLDNTKLKKNLSIKINDTPVEITGIQSVKNGNKVTENTAYLVLVDTSASMQNYFNEVQSILEEVFGFVSSKDEMAVFGVSNKLQLIKDFMSNDSSDQVSRTLRNTRRNRLTGCHFLSFRVGSRFLFGTTISAE